jgi:ribonuclease PH
MTGHKGDKMRIDGRKPDELRSVTLTPGYVVYPEGSVLITSGLTKVLCNVTIEETVPRWIQAQGRQGGWITGEYAMLPRSTHQRTGRETMGPGGRTHEIRRLIGRSLRAAVDLQKLGSRTLIVDCDVIQADGGTRTAAITGGYVALTIAIGKLIQKGTVPPDTLRAAVAAVSVGIVDGQPLLDLCYAEDSTAEVDANVVMNSKGEFIEVQTTAEGAPFSRSRLDDLVDLAVKGIDELLEMQKEALK